MEAYWVHVFVGCVFFAGGFWLGAKAMELHERNIALKALQIVKTAPAWCSRDEIYARVVAKLGWQRWAE